MTHSVVKSINRLVLVAIAAASMFNSCSCKKDDPDAGKDPATATITVTVTNRFDGANVTSASTITAKTDGNAVLSTSGNVVSLAADESYKTIDKQTVTVSATYGSYTESETVSVPFLYGGSKGSYSVTIVLGDSDYVAEKTGEPVSSLSFNYLSNATYAHALHGHAAVSHSGIEYGDEQVMFMENTTEYTLERNETYQCKTGQEVKDFASLTGPVKVAATPYNTGVNTTDETMHLVVSAWSLYAAVAVVEQTAQLYTVYEVNNGVKGSSVGTFTVVSYSTLADYVEEAHPAYESHYHYGHGHGHAGHDVHGASDNAGGGIVIAD